MKIEVRKGDAEIIYSDDNTNGFTGADPHSRRVREVIEKMVNSVIKLTPPDKTEKE